MTSYDLSNLFIQLLCDYVTLLNSRWPEGPPSGAPSRYFWVRLKKLKFVLSHYNFLSTLVESPDFCKTPAKRRIKFTFNIIHDKPIWTFLQC